MNTELATIIHFAFRYALGRRSVAPLIVADFVRKNMDTLSVVDRGQMVREIEAAARDPRTLGDECDAAIWYQLRRDLLPSQPSATSDEE